MAVPSFPTSVAVCRRTLQNACMVAITVRDVPEETRTELAVRAARSGQSMQEYLRARLVELASTPDPVELIERIRRRKEAMSSGLTAKQILDLKGIDQK